VASLKSAPGPSPVHPGAGRGAVLPLDPGRATELLYRRHSRTVFRYAWHLLGRREDAEDATQATFLSVHAALATGTAVLESGAWVLRIARNECMSRLRQRARVPAAGDLDAASERPAPGGVEQSAELRAELSTARRTLNALPVLEREAFVLREWIGLEAGEVGLALGLSPTAVEGLTGRARHSLVLAVGGLEPAVGCVGTRAALESGSIDRAAKVHLLRCPMCRGVRRALRSPESARGPLVPAAVIAERLADALPGFATGGGGVVAALVAKGAATPILVKAGAALVAAVVTVGVAGHEVQRELRPTHHVVIAPARGGEARVVSVPLATIAKSAPVVLAPTTTPLRVPKRSHPPRAVSSSRGGAATSDDGGSGSGRGVRGGESSSGGRGEGGDANRGSGSQSSGSGKSTEDGGSSVGGGKSGDSGSTKGSVGGKISGGDDTKTDTSGKGGNGDGSGDGGKSTTVGSGSSSGDDSTPGSSGSDSSGGGGGNSGSGDDGSSSHGGSGSAVPALPADPSEAAPTTTATIPTTPTSTIPDSD
jgi:RNA polymerase sigma factor (sigma-70 family)